VPGPGEAVNAGPKTALSPGRDWHLRRGCIARSDYGTAKRGFVPQRVNLGGTDDPLADIENDQCSRRQVEELLLNLAATNGSIHLRLPSLRADAAWRWDCSTHAHARTLSCPHAQRFTAVSMPKRTKRNSKYLKKNNNFRACG
jgi:hypothetical protein